MGWTLLTQIDRGTDLAMLVVTQRKRPGKKCTGQLKVKGTCQERTHIHTHATTTVEAEKNRRLVRKCDCPTQR
jgi:hypothetical protein